MKFDFENGRPFMLMAEGDPPPAGGGDAAAAAGAKPWYDGADAETVGYLQNRGLDKLPPNEAALKAAGFHREAERLIGAPANEIVRLPKDPNDAAAWAAVRTRLGAPADEKGYNFADIKHADGSALTADEVTAWSKRALTLGLRPSDAVTLVADTIKAGDEAASSGLVEKQGKIAAEKTALAQSWGPNFEANMFVAKRAAAALGVTPEAIQALEGQIGYKAVMEMMRNIGSKIGEDKFVMSQQPGGIPQAMTREQAVERKASLMADKVWVKAYLEGDNQKAAEMTALNTMIVNQR